MIRARLTSALGESTVLLGLSEANVTRLVAGEPILVDLAPLLPGAPAGAKVAIHYGATEQAIVEQLRATGLVVPHVQGGQEP